MDVFRRELPLCKLNYVVNKEGDIVHVWGVIIMETFLPRENLFISKNSCECWRLWQNCRRQSNIRLAKTFRSESEYEVGICRHLIL